MKTASVEINDLVLDKSYGAMEGPIRHVLVPVELPPSTNVAWVLGFRNEILDGTSPAPQYLCHSRLGAVPADLDIAQLRTFKSDAELKTRFLASLSQGHTEMNFPEGYGMRVALPPGKRGLVFGTQLQSAGSKRPLKMQVKAEVKYVDDVTGAAMQLKPLRLTRFAFERGQYSNVPASKEQKGHHHHHTVDVDDTLMFFVPPGKHRYTTEVRPRMPVPQATVHYIYPHLHAYATSLDIIDAKSGRSVWKGRASTNLKTGTLQSLDVYSSATGFPIFADRTYRLVVEYDNPTKKPVDAMAMATLYFD